MCKETSSDFVSLIGKKVIIDTDAHYIVIGTLLEAGAMLTLEDVDVHNITETNTPRELYVIDAAKLGVRANRKRTYLSASRVICISLLEDVIDY